MKKNLLSFCLLMLALAFSGSSEAAQVSSIRYFIRYNSTSCAYDVFMYLETGDIQPGADASNNPYQLASTNQLSIVVPTGSDVGGNGGDPFGTPSVTTYEPRRGSYNSTTNTVSRSTTTSSTTGAWAFSNMLQNPTALSGSDVYAFKTSTSNIFWPVANQGDTIRMFSISIVTPTANCGTGIRLWNNNVIKGVAVTGGDPSSAASGMGGQDFNNGMGIGSPAQIYNGNGVSQTSQAKPAISSFSVTRVGTTAVTGTVVATSGSSCAAALGNTYAWSGPSSYSTAGTTVGGTTNTFTRTPAVAGTYTVTVTNSLGCTATHSALIAIPLPIHLLSFTGIANACKAQLAWEIGSGDKDFQRFEVQYSGDGARFVTVGEMERNPYNDHYSYSYVQPSGKGYYRLKIIDLGGKATYSDIISVSTDCNAPEITIAPNPTTAISTVSGIEAGDQVKVTDVLGNVIANYVSGGAKATIDLGMYPPAVYNVIITRGTEIIKTDKITKM